MILKIFPEVLQKLSRGKGLSIRNFLKLSGNARPPSPVDNRLASLEDSVRRCFYGLLRANLANDYLAQSPTQCPACKSARRDDHYEEVNAKCMFTSADLRRFRCDNCGTIFGPISLIKCVPDHLADLYTLLYRYFKEGDTTQYQERAFFALEPVKGKKYLNFACGTWGLGIVRLRDMGFDVYGFEPSLESQHPAIFTSIEDVARNGPYDGIFTHNFIEHVQDPFAFFSQIRDLSMPGAKVAHSSACYDYRYEKSPFHLYFLSHTALEMIGSVSGHTILNRRDYDLDVPGQEVTIYTFVVDQALVQEI